MLWILQTDRVSLALGDIIPGAEAVIQVTAQEEGRLFRRFAAILRQIYCVDEESGELRVDGGAFVRVRREHQEQCRPEWVAIVGTIAKFAVLTGLAYEKDGAMELSGRDGSLRLPGDNSGLLFFKGVVV